MELATTEPPLLPPKRKVKWWHGVIIVIAGLLVIGVFIKGVLAPPDNAAGMRSPTNSFTVSVRSSPRDTADVDVNDNGRWSQTSSQSLPWSETFGPGIVSVAAEKGGSNGSITCTITNSDGSVRDTQTSTGPYAEVACNTNRGNSGTTGSAGNSGTSGNS